MGADGGSIPDRSDMVKTKARSKVTDKDILREIFFLCALSKRPLARPVVLDPLGKTYNKDAIIEFFLDRSQYGDGDRICGYLKGVKDLLTLNLFPNPEYTAPTATTTNHIPSRSPFVCPLSFKEMSGTVPFIALRPCGCVFSESSIRGMIPNLTKGPAASVEKEKEQPDEAKPVTEKKGTVSCPNCGIFFDPTLSTSILPINPPKEVQDILLDNLLAARAAAKSSKKRKAPPISAVNDTESEFKVPAKITKSSTNTKPKVVATTTNSNNTGSRTVAQKLADQESKRLKAQEGMSDAVKAMFKAKDGDQRGTGGAADFFGRTYTRYA